MADKKLKIGLIDDMLTVIDLEGVRIGTEEIVGGFDLLCRNGERFRTYSEGNHGGPNYSNH